MALVDEKDGWCSSCRNGSHGLCASRHCSCPNVGRRNHELRPRISAANTAALRPIVPDPPQSREAKANVAKPTKVATFELVEEEPPEPVVKTGFATQVGALLEQLRASGSVAWHRVVFYEGSMSANGAKSRLERRFPDWEWRAGRTDSGAGVWVKAK